MCALRAISDTPNVAHKNSEKGSGAGFAAVCWTYMDVYERCASGTWAKGYSERTGNTFRNSRGPEYPLHQLSVEWTCWMAWANREPENQTP